MKKLLLSTAIAIVTTLSSFAATSNDVSYNAFNHFKQTYSGATNVEWKVNTDYVKATFIFDGEKQEAFYDLNGNVIGTSKAITLKALPEAAIKTLNKKYSSFKAVEAIEFTTDEDQYFYVSMANDVKTEILKISATGDVSVAKTIMK